MREVRGVSLPNLPKALERLKPGVSIEWDPDGSVLVMRPGQGITRHLPNSEMALGLRRLLGPLAPRPLLSRATEVRIVDIDHAARVVTFARKYDE